VISSPLLLLSLPRTLALVEVVLAIAAIGLMVYLTIGHLTSDRQNSVLRLVGLLVLVSLMLGGVQYLIR
jgi:hypothetical protein